MLHVVISQDSMDSSLSFPLDHRTALSSVIDPELENYYPPPVYNNGSDTVEKSGEGEHSCLLASSVLTTVGKDLSLQQDLYF